MNTPTVSIVIPAYNAEAYGVRCLDSILELSYTDWECIVVNDGSTDRTPEILIEYAKKNERIHVFNKQNGGVSTARNVGIKQAQGEWITFIDIDDCVSPDFLQQEDFTTKSELIIKNWQYTDGKASNEEIPYDKTLPLRGEIGIANYLHYSVFRTPWAKLFRTDIIKKNGINFNPNFKLGEDNLFVLEYLQHVKNTTITRGRYMYERPNRGKYPLRFEESRKYVKEFNKIFKQLYLYNPILVHHILIWYSSFTIDFTIRNKIEWYMDADVHSLYVYAKNKFPLKEKAKILFFSILKKIL